MALSKVLRPPSMITSPFNPVVSVIEGVEGFRAEVVAVVLPIRSPVDELRVARIAGGPQFEPAGQNRF